LEVKPAAQFVEKFHILLTPKQKAGALAIADARRQSIAELFRSLLDRELAAEAESARRLRRPAART
jgi:hypothetical protein